MISIYDFTNYQLFLKEYYDEQKKVRKGFSYQFLADHCGFKSKTFIYKIIHGDKPLNVSGALKIGEFMKLKKRELDYFEAIVMFSNAKTSDERKFYFDKLQRFSCKSKSSLLRKHQFEFFSHWYNSVIRELVEIADWDNDYSLLAKLVIPHISVREAKQSVELLLKLGFIEEYEEGKYRRSFRAMSTGSDVISLAVHDFQKENLQLASEAIDRFPRSKRDISTLTVSVNDEGAKRIMAEVAEFRKKLVGIVAEYPEVDSVYQINFQTFPLSLPKRDKK